MSRHRKPAAELKPNPAWRYSPPRSGWITLYDDEGNPSRRVYVTEVDACAVAPLLPKPEPTR